MTHGNPCVTRHAKANACVTHDKSCVHMHVNGEIYKKGREISSYRTRATKRKGRKKIEKKKKREKERKGREKEGEKEISVPTVGTCWTKK